MSWLTSLFSTGPTAATKLVDAGIKGLDAMVYTDEEKAVARQKLQDGWVEANKVLIQESSVRSVTRRLLTFILVIPYVTMIVVAAALFPWVPDYSKFLMDVAQGDFGMLTIAAAGFYFGPYFIGRSMKK